MNDSDNVDGNDGTELLHLLPYLRRGLVRHVAEADPRRGAIGPAQVDLSLAVEGQVADTSVALLAPHRVAALTPSEIVRRWPTPGAVDVETNYFPLIEFEAPDLPWRYTPASPGGDGQLRPWLVLVVVVEGDGVSYEETSGLGRLVVSADQIHDQLPPAGETWAWAHVQSSRPADEVAAVDTEPDALRARLLAPRWLEPDVTYRCALVNGFRAGADEVSEPAWPDPSDTDPADKEVVLDVFDTWTFTTAREDGDFESLCELLRSADEVERLGIREVDVTKPGVDVEWPDKAEYPVVAELIGALADPDGIVDRPPPHNAAFVEAVEPMLAESLSRAKDEDAPADGYDAAVDDPVVGLPFYGAWPSRATEVPTGGWAHEVNVRSDHRMAAGLGARIVRRHQEALMAAAWDQLGDVRGVGDELNRARLAAEVGRSWQARVAKVEAGDRLVVAGPLLPYVRVGGRPATAVLADANVPTAVADRVWLRRTPRTRGSAASTAYVTGVDRALAFQQVLVPQGTTIIDGAVSATTTTRVTLPAKTLDHVRRHRVALGAEPLLPHLVAAEPDSPPRPRRRRPQPRSRPRRVQPDGTAIGGGTIDGPIDRPVDWPRTWPVAVDVSSVADAVAELDPLLATRAALVDRVAGLDDLLPAAELPAELQLVPEFLDPVLDDLLGIDDDVVAPGFGDFPPNRVRLLGVNPGFVAACLVGANHAMADEFRWREFPADLAGTFFRRFFGYHDPATTDIDPIEAWKPEWSLTAQVPSASETTAILIRGDLIRRYPDVNIFIAPPAAGGDEKEDEDVIDTERVEQPIFETRLGADARVVGFAIAPEVVTGDEVGGVEHYIVFEERMVAPRFGLDLVRDTPAFDDWDELARTDFDPIPIHTPATEISDALGAPTHQGVQWGRNGAHLGAATHQRPYRRAFPARSLVGGAKR